MSEDSLKEIHTIISSKRISLTYDEARSLAERALKFLNERGKAPSISSNDPWERRMAEGIQYLANKEASDKS